jgi:hypothetical protein
MRSWSCDLKDCISRSWDLDELGEAGEDALGDDLDDDVREFVEERVDLEDVPEYDEVSDAMDDVRPAEDRLRRVVSISSWTAAKRSMLAPHFSTMSSAWF